MSLIRELKYITLGRNKTAFKEFFILGIGYLGKIEDE